MEVIIIGAGTTGLLLAQGLTNASPPIPCTVYERESPEYYRNRTREWGMSLHWGSADVDSLLPEHLKARIKEIWCDPFHEWKDGEKRLLPQTSGHNGEMLFELEVPDGMRVSRRKMRNLFSEGIAVKYGKVLKEVVDNGASVSAVFEDGSKATGSVIIGCDGSKSAVRKALVGPQKAENTYLPISLINVALKFDPETAQFIRRSFNPIWNISYHKNNWMTWLSAQDIGDPADPKTWTFQFMTSWKSPPGRDDLPTQQDRLNFLKTRAKEYAEPWRTVLNNIPEDAKFGIDRLGTWLPFDWSDMSLASKVTLAGDAAHAMAPFRGQGLNNAMEDAALLKQHLVEAVKSGPGLTAALRLYETEMRERALREIEISGIAAEMAHNYEAFMNGPLAKFGVRKPTDDDVKDQRSRIAVK